MSVSDVLLKMLLIFGDDKFIEIMDNQPVRILHAIDEEFTSYLGINILTALDVRRKWLDGKPISEIARFLNMDARDDNFAIMLTDCGCGYSMDLDNTESN